MSLKEQQALVAALGILATAAESVSDDVLDRVLHAYNYLHRRLDGDIIFKPSFPNFQFKFDSKLQMMVSSGVN